MKKSYTLPKGIEYNNGELILIRCPKCDRENYALNVLTGICTWCGYNAHKDETIKERLRRIKE